MAACASGPESSSVTTVVEAWPSGVSLTFADVGGQARVLVEIHDYAGTSETLAWQIPNIQFTPAYKDLVTCVGNVRGKGQSPEKTLRAATLRCVEASGMPPPQVIAEPDATEYRVSVTVGILGARRRVRLTSALARPVSTDVDECMLTAEKQGIAIQSLMGRLDTCLRKRAYLVDEPPRSK